MEALDQHGVDISKQGVDKRFNSAGIEFIKTVFERHLALKVGNESIEVGWLVSFGQVRIKDSTRFDVPEEFIKELPGSGGSASKAGVCIQYEYDVKSGKILDLTITPANRPDQTDAKETKENIQKGDLLIRDLGYFVLKSFSYFNENEAYYISRLSPTTHVYQKKGGKLKKLDFHSIYNQMSKKGIPRMEKQVLIGKTAQIPVRLIIELMPEEVYSKRMQKVNKENKKKGNHTSQEYSTRARFNLFITNIPMDMLVAPAVSALYKIRWQIELIFKVWKSTFGINKTRKMKYQRWLCLLYAKLLTIIINWQIILAHRIRFYNQYGRMLSVDKCFKTLKEALCKIRNAIRQGAEALTQIMNWITRIFSRKHWLERKKKKVGFEETLYLMFCKSGVYVYF